MIRRTRSPRVTAAAAALGALGALAVFGSCASPGIPPGGPPDSDIPVLVRILPDSNATNVRADLVRLHFDEVISERPGNPRATVGAGGQRPTAIPSVSGMGIGAGAGLASIVQISPSDGRERVDWRRTAIEIKPRGGFRPNTTYRVTVLPGVADLRGNVIATPLEFVFSTGSEILAGEIRGVVFDWAAAGPARQARVEVFPVGDSAYRWSARADSLGRFVLRDLSPGRYLLRGWVDTDNDRRLGTREMYDSATVSMDGGAAVELYAYVRDTVPAQIEAVNVVDSLTLQLRFDRALRATWDPTGAVEVIGADSVVRPLARVMPRAQLDSLRRAGTPTGAAGDTSTADTTQAVAAASPPGPVFGRAAPVQLWAATLDAPLAPGLYRLRVRGALGLNGLPGDSEREFRVREPTPPPPADTTSQRP